jgi:hypothetical protein
MTDASGRWGRCGLTPGKIIRVEALGMGRGKLGVRQRVIESGRNEFVIRANRVPRSGSPDDKTRTEDGPKRPRRFRRP